MTKLCFYFWLTTVQLSCYKTLLTTLWFSMLNTISFLHIAKSWLYVLHIISRTPPPNTVLSAPPLPHTQNIQVTTQTSYLPEYSNPKIPKICDPILVTLLKMQPHYSQSSCEKCNPIQQHIPISLLLGIAPPDISFSIINPWST